MNIKISIKDCQCPPTSTLTREVSEVQHRKRTMLYAPPENDKNMNGRQTAGRTGSATRSRQVNKGRNANAINKNINSNQYRQSEREMLNQLKKQGQNQATVNMVQNGQLILQKQNQILLQNQRTLQQMANQNVNPNSSQATHNQRQAEAIRNQVKQALDQIRAEVVEIKKIRTQIVSATQQFNKNVGDMRNARSPIPANITEMNNNIRNIAQHSQNHIQGLQNLQALKSLQNFNMEGYSQAISTLKRQIAQYLKQSENIQRELKIRTAKLQKLQLPPKFEEQLYRPYQQHLANRVKSIDLHAIKDKVYEKIGTFDYAKFQNDANAIMAEAKNQLANFDVITKQYKIVVPDIRIDAKQLKNIDMKLPSVLDEYKAARNIKFEDPSKTKLEQAAPSRGSKTSQIQQILKQTQSQQNSSKRPQNLQRLPSSKPVDLANQTKLTKQSDKKPTILQNLEEGRKDKKQHEQRMKRNNAGKQKKGDQEFDKYLQNRAREQLEIMYKQKKERLQKMQNQLYEQATAPVYINLDINRQQVQPKKQPASPKKPQKRGQQQKQEGEEYQQEFQKQSNQQQKNPKKPIISEVPNANMNIKQIGRDILKEKLKNLLGERQRNKSPHITHSSNFNTNLHRPQQAHQQGFNTGGQRQMQNMAEGLIAIINNTLTQVNQNLSKSIQKRMEQGGQNRPISMQKKGPKIQVPKLQAFRPPPVFNMNMNLVQQPTNVAYNPMPLPSYPNYPQNARDDDKKIVVQNYDKYKIEEQRDYDDYQISSDEDQQP